MRRGMSLTNRSEYGNERFPKGFWDSFNSAASAEEFVTQYKKSNLKTHSVVFGDIVKRCVHGWGFRWDNKEDVFPAFDFFLAEHASPDVLRRGMIAAVLGDDAGNDRYHYDEKREERQLRVIQKLLEKGADPNEIFLDGQLAKELEREVFSYEKQQERVNDIVKNRRIFIHDYDARKEIEDEVEKQIEKEILAFFKANPRVQLCRISPADKAVLSECYQTAKFLVEAGGKFTSNGFRHFFESQSHQYRRYESSPDEEFPLPRADYNEKALNVFRESGADVDREIHKIYIRVRIGQELEKYSEQKEALLPAIENLHKNGATFSGSDIVELLELMSKGQQKDMERVIGLIALLDPDQCTPESAQEITDVLQKQNWFMKRGEFERIRGRAHVEKRGHLIPGKNNPVGMLGFWLAAIYIGKSYGRVPHAGVDAMDENQERMFATLAHQSGYEWKKTFGKLRKFPFQRHANVKDYLQEFFRYVILPAALMRVGKEFGNIPADMANYLMKGLEDRLLPATTEVLSAQKGIVQLMEASDRWHLRRGRFIMAKPTDEEGKTAGIRDYAFEGAWHRLLPQKTVEVPKDVSPDKLEIVNLESAGELYEEHTVLGHCIDSYDTDCRKGVSHILSVRSESNPRLRSTIEIKFEKGKPYIEQHEGFKDQELEPECKKAGYWFLKQIEAGTIEINTAKRGQIYRRGELSLLLAHIGYEPTAERIERAFAVFQDHQFQEGVRVDPNGVTIMDPKASSKLKRAVAAQERQSNLISGNFHTMNVQEFLEESGLSAQIDRALDDLGIQVRSRVIKQKPQKQPKFEGLGLA
jgi:hypothetical protein